MLGLTREQMFFDEVRCVAWWAKDLPDLLDSAHLCHPALACDAWFAGTAGRGSILDAVEQRRGAVVLYRAPASAHHAGALAFPPGVECEAARRLSVAGWARFAGNGDPARCDPSRGGCTRREAARVGSADRGSHLVLPVALALLTAPDLAAQYLDL